MMTMNSAKQIRPNRNYPRDWSEFQGWFPDDEACAVYLARLRWPTGYVCPTCGPMQSWTKTRGRLVCANCRRETTVTAGTVFDGTHKSLRTWFEAIWHLANEQSGISVKDFQRILGLGSYKTAWTWIRRLHLAMAPRGSDLLRGTVEVDTTRIQARPGVADTRAAAGIIVAIAVEADDGGLRRTRVAQVPDLSARSLTEFVASSVEPGALVRTTSQQGYSALATVGFRHRVAAQAGDDQQRVAFGTVRQVAAALGDWLYRARTKAVLPQPLGLYLDLFTFRFNHREVREPGELFYLLLRQLIKDGYSVRERASRAG